MLVHRDGTTRIVFQLKHIAIKVARHWCGARCNLCEAKIYKEKLEWREHLCPVYWCAPFGLFLVAKAVPHITEEEAAYLRKTKGFPDWNWDIDGPIGPFEPKATDWGRLNGKLVALDYSNCVGD